MKQIYFTIMFAFVAVSAFSQRGDWRDRRDPSLAVGLQLSEPKGEFANNIDGLPFGVAGNFTAPVANSPFEFGVGFAWNSMAARNEDVAIIAGQDAQGNDVFEEAEMRIRSNNYRYQAVARFRPFVRRIQIYGDLIAGVERFTTSTDIQINSNGYSEVTDANTVERDFGWTLGWAAGARVRLSNTFFLDARFEKLEGGVATYVNPDSIEVDAFDNTLNYTTNESRTDKFTYQLGIAVHF
ncbi:MAG: outer membrane beta-barrel protein [Flavobacteriales bacterium]|jgi:hypothetical protein